MGSTKAFAVLRGPDPTAGGLLGGEPVGLEHRHDEGSVLMRHYVEAVWDARRQLFGHVGSRSWAHGSRSRSASS